MMKISEGIGRHMLGKSATDPLSNVQVRRPHVDDVHRSQVDVLDTFPGLKPLRHLIANARQGVNYIQRGAKVQFTLSLVAILLTGCGFASTTRFLVTNDPDLQKLSVVPVLCIVLFGMAVNFLVFSSKRLTVVRQLQANIPQPELLQRVMVTREEIIQTQQFRCALRIRPIDQSVGSCMTCKRCMTCKPDV
jgi:hypothetical protein